ncbi:MAG TPA: dienelactone hydrolase family protein [Candidatus Dormibacteraeota bacterium]|nr:dienelactone hydrolase family protein [Candidatus Dormibacteraeota bacterium]
MRDDIRAETVTIPGHGREPIEAYLAQPLAGEKGGGVVVIHHLPGYDLWSKEVTRTFAARGYLAICPNLYSREAPGASPDDAAATVRAKGGIPDEGLVGDVGGAAAYLRQLPASNGSVGVIGYCSGGRQAVLAACSLPLQAAVDCYGAFVLGEPPPEFPLKVKSLFHLLPQISCPLLGLFGADDSHPSPAETAELERALSEQGADFEFHTYPGAGHAFFATDRPGFRPEAAKEGWEEIFEFFGRHLIPAGA